MISNIEKCDHDYYLNMSYELFISLLKLGRMKFLHSADILNRKDIKYLTYFLSFH